jgi:hypothetical protein
MTANGNTELAKVERAAPAVGGRGIEIRGYDDLARLAAMAYKSGLAGKAFQNVEAVGVAIATGMEIGLSPMQSLQCITVINGKPGLNGTGAKALVEASGLLEDFDEWFQIGDKRVAELPGPIPDDAAAYCMAKRKGRRPKTVLFSVADAKRAGLWGKPGPWTQYPPRMMRFRALGFCLNDVFPDVLKGFKTAEELADYPEETSRAANTPARPARVEPKVVESVAPDKSQTLQEAMATQEPPAEKPPTPRAAHAAEAATAAASGGIRIDQRESIAALAEELRLNREQLWEAIRQATGAKKGIGSLSNVEADHVALHLRRNLADVYLTELAKNLDDVRQIDPSVKADVPAELGDEEAVAALSVLRAMHNEELAAAGTGEVG